MHSKIHPVILKPRGCNLLVFVKVLYFLSGLGKREKQQCDLQDHIPDGAGRLFLNLTELLPKSRAGMSKPTCGPWRASFRPLAQPLYVALEQAL